MLHAQYQQIGPMVLEKKSFEWILPYIQVSYRFLVLEVSTLILARRRKERGPQYKW